MQSFSAGMAASGAITSALRLVTKAAFENSRDGLRKGARMDPLPFATFSSEHDISLRFLYLIIYVIYAVLFFSISCFFALLCLLLYAYVFPKLPIVKFYRAKAASEGSLTVMADLAAAGIGKHPNPLVSTFLTSSVVFSR